SADLLRQREKTTAVFVGLCSVEGCKGCGDRVGEIGGFGSKLYSDEGKLDLVGNKGAVSFIEDGIKFGEFVDGLKAE
ncbi:catalase, partial [Staphylococcus hominis]|uniref:catalase n=1 Tax=Staphylococcus hominis TaxID=1290 RepID=UPI00119EBBAF